MLIDELFKISKEGFERFDKEEMSKDKVIPVRNCFCAFVKRDISTLDETFFDVVHDKDCNRDLYTANYDKEIDDTLKQVAMKYAPDSDTIRISPCDENNDS